ncbi:hypothetical protein QVA66_11600 [Staphylococcus chromogenes]|nr:hypothetical protein [Staphylococcus chromogenes]
MVSSFLISAFGALLSALTLHNLPLFVTGLVLGGLGSGAIMSCASVAIVGAAPISKIGMASSIEEISFEFGNLIAVALLGSLLSQLFAVFAPGMPLTHPLIDAARPAYDQAYLGILYFLAALGLGTTLWSWRLFREVPSEVLNAH